MPEREVPKRLPIEKDTLRELYLRSGNQCAFPGCSQLILDQDGDCVGEICHIEDAMPGCRFNKDSNNEARRHVSNLMLLCRIHHTKTNDPVRYPAEALRQMKAEHEAKFSDPAAAMLKKIEDHTKKITPAEPSTLQGLNEVLGWGLEPWQLAEDVKPIKVMIEHLRMLPLPTRHFLIMLVERAKQPSSHMPYLVRHNEVRDAALLSDAEVREHVSTLVNYKFVKADYDDEFNPEIRLRSFGEHGEWHFWASLRDFCKLTSIPLAKFIVDLRFDLLDAPPAPKPGTDVATDASGTTA